MLSTWRQCGTSCVSVCAGGDAVESVNQSSAPHREAEAAADLYGPQWLPLQCEGSNLPAGRTQHPQTRLQRNAALNSERQPHKHGHIYLSKAKCVQSDTEEPIFPAYI